MRPVSLGHFPDSVAEFGETKQENTTRHFMQIIPKYVNYTRHKLARILILKIDFNILKEFNINQLLNIILIPCRGENFI